MSSSPDTPHSQLIEEIKDELGRFPASREIEITFTRDELILVTKALGIMYQSETRPASTSTVKLGGQHAFPHSETRDLMQHSDALNAAPREAKAGRASAITTDAPAVAAPDSDIPRKQPNVILSPRDPDVQPTDKPGLTAKAEHWRAWGIDGMPGDKKRLAEATWAAAIASSATHAITRAEAIAILEVVNNSPYSLMPSLQEKLANMTRTDSEVKEKP